MAYTPGPTDKPVCPEAIARALEIRKGSLEQISQALQDMVDELVLASRSSDSERADFISQILAGYVVTQPKKMSAAEYDLFMLAAMHSLDRENP